MAKELPFFKFEPSQWENGSIQVCSFEAQGIFINLCSMYWQRLGDLPYKLAVQKICKGNATAFDSLVTDHIIQVIDGMICIDFLNEQLEEFENNSKTNSENARLGWQKRRNNATAKQPHSDPNAIREEKKREEEEKKRLEENTSDFDENFLKAFDENTCESYKLPYRDIDLGGELQKFRIKCDNNKSKYYAYDVGALRSAFQYQLNNVRKNGKGTNNKQQHTNSIKDTIRNTYGYTGK